MDIVALTVNDDILVSDLKEKYSSAIQEKPEIERLRIFYSGIEMKNDKKIYQYDIKANHTMIVSIKPIDNDNDEDTNNE